MQQQKQGPRESEGEEKGEISPSSASRQGLVEVGYPFLTSRRTASTPLLSIVLNAAAERRSVTNLFSLGIQTRFENKFGKKRRFVQPVILRPIPFFFFAMPLRVYFRPLEERFFVTTQVLGITLPLLTLDKLLQTPEPLGGRGAILPK
jgi:hypothetical protein